MRTGYLLVNGRPLTKSLRDLDAVLRAAAGATTEDELDAVIADFEGALSAGAFSRVEATAALNALQRNSDRLEGAAGERGGAAVEAKVGPGASWEGPRGPLEYGRPVHGARLGG